MAAKQSKKHALASKKPAWRPASMGATKGKILGVPTNHLLWGGGGAAASLITSYAAGSIFQPLEAASLNPTLIGSFISAAAGYGILSASKGYEKSAMPWAVGSIIPLAAKTLYDFLFAKPIPAPAPAPEPAPAPTPGAIPVAA